MNPSPIELLAYLQKHYPDGIYQIVYEASFSGFCALRIFRHYHIDCIIVNPTDVPTSNKEKVNKNDPLDSRKLSRELENQSLHSIYIPNTVHEELHMLMRLRYRIIQSQTRTKIRINGLLGCAHGSHDRLRRSKKPRHTELQSSEYRIPRAWSV